MTQDETEDVMRVAEHLAKGVWIRPLLKPLFTRYFFKTFLQAEATLFKQNWQGEENFYKKMQ